MVGILYLVSPRPGPARQEFTTPQSSPFLSTVASSSPFTNTPIHFPISVANARRPLSVPASDTSPMSRNRPTSIPISFRFPIPTKNQSAEHHRGEYSWTRATNAPDDSDTIRIEVGMSPRTRQLKAVERRIEMREDSQASLISELDEEQVQKHVETDQPRTSGHARRSVPRTRTRSTSRDEQHPFPRRWSFRR